MKHKYEKTLRIILVGVGIILLSMAFYQIWTRFYNPYIRLPFFRRGNYVLTLLYALVLTVCILIMKGQNLGEAHLMEIVISQCIALFLTTLIIYFPMSLLQYELLSPWPLMALMFGQWLLTVLWDYFANRIYFKLIPPPRTLLIFSGKQEHWIAKKLNGLPERYNVCGEISIMEGRNVISERINDYDAVLLSVKDDEWRAWLVRLCFERDMPIFLFPTLTDVVVNSAKPHHSMDTPLLCSTDHRLTIEERAFKRVLDIFGSVMLLTLASPILLFTAAAIKLGDGGPVFFRQERLTRDSKKFRIFKFRSMVVDAEKYGQRLASEHDDRITSVGRIIRKLRIDELPQLFNVLKGDMSLVGPRPECPSLAAEYEKVLPDFAYRLKVKAGITGYAQVYGNYSTHPMDKLLMDIMYIENSSILLDINLILLTARVLFMTEKTKGTEDVSGEQKFAGQQ